MWRSQIYASALRQHQHIFLDIFLRTKTKNLTWSMVVFVPITRYIKQDCVIINATCKNFVTLISYILISNPKLQTLRGVETVTFGVFLLCVSNVKWSVNPVWICLHTNCFKFDTSCWHFDRYSKSRCFTL